MGRPGILTLRLSLPTPAQTHTTLLPLINYNSTTPSFICVYVLFLCDKLCDLSCIIPLYAKLATCFWGFLSPSWRLSRRTEDRKMTRRPTKYLINSTIIMTFYFC